MRGKTIKENKQYTISQSGSNLVFTWKQVTDLSIEDMAKGIIEFAGQCKNHQPDHALIDARLLNPKSPAIGWVSGQQRFDDQEAYMAWWTREIAPIYNDAGISRLAVATGNPNAPGELSENPPGVEFKMGYFNGLDDATNWGR